MGREAGACLDVAVSVSALRTAGVGSAGSAIHGAMWISQVGGVITLQTDLLVLFLLGFSLFLFAVFFIGLVFCLLLLFFWVRFSSKFLLRHALFIHAPSTSPLSLFRPDHFV